MPVTPRDALGVPFDLPSGEPADSPQVGDVWLLAIGDQIAGVVMVAAVRPTHVLAWPVTNPSDDAAAPAFPFTLLSGEGLVAWPDAEFGLSMATLYRRLAPLVLDDRRLRAIRWSMGTGEEVPGHQPCPSLESERADAAFEAVCASAWTMGEWSWPNSRVGVGVFSPEALEEAEVRPADLGRHLGLKPVRASALARGEKVPSGNEVARVIELFPEGTTSADILRPPRGDDAEVLAHPEFKADVLQLVEATGTPEDEARSVVWEAACSRAARQAIQGDRLGAARARVAFAIESLLEN